MRKFTSLAILGLMWLAGSAAFADDHEYVNGFCTMHDDCDAPYEQPELDADGFYLLCNAGNVEWLGVQINSGNIQLDAKLMNDIDFEGKENLHYMIGDTEGHKYNGTFDGQGHRIKNLYMNYPDRQEVGFFGWLRGNARNTVVRNLIMDKSCTIIGKHRVGAVSGCCQNNASGITITLENIVNEAHVVATTGTDVGGLMGGRKDGSPVFIVRNYINTGLIEALAAEEGTQTYAGALCGWMGDNGSNLYENIINIGEIKGMPADGRAIGRVFGTQRNFIDLSGSEGATQGIVDELVPEDIASGKLAYYINTLAGQNVFFQTLGEDEYPVPFSTHKQVYMQGELMCDGTPLEGGTYTNDPVEPVRPPHEFEDGDWHCINCGAINEEYCELVDGFYQLNNELDVCWFAEFTKAGHVDVNAKLNSDLDFTDYPDFSGIADRDHGFKGIFDGGFHTISNMDMSWRTDEDWVGFINFLNGGATVKNLRGDATCFISAHGNAGLIGGSTAAGDIFLENLGFEGDVTCTRAGAGGILGCNTGSQAHIYMTNCYATGNISGWEVMENGALSAWLGGDGAVITNCWSTATVSGYQNGDKYLARFNSATFNNCYCVVPEEIVPLYATIIQYEDVENGALCYKLNGDQEEIVWYQNIDEDEFPTFMPGHKQVYVVVNMRCDGWFDPLDATYSNTPSAEKPDHQFVDGFCKVCHQQDPDFPFLDVFANADHDITEGYINSDSGDGSGLAINNSVAEHWDTHWFETFQTIKGLEPGIYRLRLQGLTRAEQWKNDVGSAYENGILSEEYAPLYHSSQYFAEVNGLKLANRFMDIAEGRQQERVGETENFNDITGMWVPNSLAACNKYFARGLYWNEPLYFAIESEEDSVNIGVENSLYLYGNWTVWDSWRLDKLDDGDIDLIRAQQVAAIQHELEGLEPQVSLMEAYNEAKEAIENANTLEKIMSVADVLARNPNLIRRSHLAYEAFKEAIATLAEERASRDDLNGAATDLLDKYLEQDEESSQELPNGTYQNIINARLLSEEELTAEIAFARSLYENAIMTSINVGSDISHLIKNAGFNEDGSFKDWETVRTYESPDGSNFSSNTGFTDIYPVAGTWNTAFTVSQYIVADIPDGIYELEAPAFYRPGGNGMGDLEGNDYVPADLFINDYFTPIMNIYAGRVHYADAVNGVNCRYDANVTEDDSYYDPDNLPPHNGENTSSQDFDTGDGYVPEQRQAVSFAFGGGRYINNVYGIVQGGELRLGIRNTGKPWYESGMTMWGRFKLIYRGQSEGAIIGMMDNFRSRLDALKYAHDEQMIMYYSWSHIDKLEALIAEADNAPLQDKLPIIKQINDEFNTILDSYDAYADLLALGNYCDEKANEFAESDPTKAEAFAEAYSEIFDHYSTGDLTDEEARNYRETILNDPALGGGYYVQGDLIDAEGNALDYGTRNTNYPMTLQEDGTYTATVKVQNRANRPNSESRAGLFISRMEEVYKADQSTRRFVTPTVKSFTLARNAGNDLQMVGGEYKITFNPADGSIVLDLIGEYPWHDNVYVVGSIIDVNGEQHRYKNDEMAPLAHKGNGVYEGAVYFFQDPNNSMYPNFTIMACRSNSGSIAHSTTTRSNWTEGRYGSEEDKLLIENGVVTSDLIRGLDRKWYMNWDERCKDEKQKYRITFDMNRNTVKVISMQGDVNDDDTIDIADAVTILNAMAGQQVNGNADVNGDGTVDIADFVTVLNIMAGM